MATSPDYTILSRPRISASGFAAVLRGAGSPASSVADACYGAFVDAGVDPAVALAIFRKESTYGKFGRANRNRSWGNIRGSSPPLDDKRFKIYSSWTAGAVDMARLLTVYGTNRIRPGTNTSTVQTLPYVWAPSSDGNAPDAYGDSLARWIGEWAAKYPASGGGGAPGAYRPPAEQPRGGDAGGTVLSLVSARSAASCSTVTIVAPPNQGAEWAGLYPIPRTLVGAACVECAAGWVPAIVSVGPVQTVQGYVSPEDAPGKANACVKAGTQPGDRPGAGGVPGQIADSIPAAIAAFGDVLGQLVISGALLVGLIIIVLLGLYLIATSDG